jgi:hypothetical protein
MVSNPEFYADRKISGTTDQLLCLIQLVYTDSSHVFEIRVYDPVKGTCEILPPMDDPHFAAEIVGWFHCAAVNRKLVLIHGMQSVYIYDFESARWRRGANMPTRRYLFACSVDSSTGLVYVVGGVDEPLNPLAAAEAYNVEEDTWEILPPMIQPHGLGCHDVLMEGKFMVFTGDRDRSAEVFDPSAGTWRRWENMRFRGDLWKKCEASPSGELYAFSNAQQQVMKYDGEKNVWTAVASTLLTYVNCATQWRHWFFVSGFGPKKNVCYLFNPSTGQWIEVNGGGGECPAGMVVAAAATLEI